ncbi:MAG TPA: phosphoribosyltransferase [Planctomycetota bacterium]|nr:phosphoribosyltransferase [Planctomycetota bacterium]
MITRIITEQTMVFRNRVEAGRLLAEQLADLAEPGCVVMAIPRGGVVVGAEIAAKLRCDLDVIIVRKLGAPHNPELAIGSIMEGAEKPYLNGEIIAGLGVSADYISHETDRQRAEAERRAELYRAGKPRSDIKGRTVFLTDDGVATGATMFSSIRGVKLAGAGKVLVALPVGPRETIDELSEEVDYLVCLSTPAFFGAVGRFYEDFSQTTDEEVVEILKRFAPAMKE